jgi:hypothetical protein
LKIHGHIREVCGWGTWIRTKIDGVRVRCSTVELSPTRSSQKVTQSAKTGVRLRQVETKHMQLHAHAADDADAFAEIDLRVAGQMDERDEDLARSGAGGPHVILHRRVAAGVPMFDPQPFENTVSPCGSGSGHRITSELSQHRL